MILKKLIPDQTSAQSINPNRTRQESDLKDDNLQDLNSNLKDQRIMAYWAQNMLEDLQNLIASHLSSDPDND